MRLSTRICTWLRSALSRESRGVALLLSLLLVTLITMLVLFVAAIATSQVRLAGSSVDSSRAFAAADAGIEYALSRINLQLRVDRLCSDGWYPRPPLSSGTEYCLTVDNAFRPTRVTAVGRTTDTGIRRSLEVILPVFAAVNGMGAICVAGPRTGTLDDFCSAAPGPGSANFRGATGLIGIGAGACGSSSADSRLAITFDAGGSGVSYTVGGSAFWIIQCYQ